MSQIMNQILERPIMARKTKACHAGHPGSGSGQQGTMMGSGGSKYINLW